MFSSLIIWITCKALHSLWHFLTCWEFPLWLFGSNGVITEVQHYPEVLSNGSYPVFTNTNSASPTWTSEFVGTTFVDTISWPFGDSFHGESPFSDICQSSSKARCKMPDRMKSSKTKLCPGPQRIEHKFISYLEWQGVTHSPLVSIHEAIPYCPFLLSSLSLEPDYITQFLSHYLLLLLLFLRIHP